MRDKLLLIDLTNIIYRFFFAFIKNPLRNTRGFNTSAIYGVTSFLKEIIKEQNVEYALCAVDLKKKTFRHDMFRDYKSGRMETPDELVSQIEPIYSAIKMMGIPLEWCEGYEADDVIGTVSKKFRDDFNKILIVTADKDMGQLVDEKTFILYPKKENNSYPVLNVKSIEEKLNIRKEQITDYFALIGDKVDAVPGIEGVGPKTAEKILKEADSVEDILEHPEKISNEKIRQRISDMKEELKLYKKLVTINTDAPLNIKTDDMKIKPADIDSLNGFFKEYELFSMMQKEVPEVPERKPFEKTDSLERILSEKKDVVLFLFDNDVFVNSGNIICMKKKECIEEESVLKMKDRVVVTNNLKSMKNLYSLIGKAEILDVQLLSQTQMRHGGVERVVKEYSGANFIPEGKLSLFEEFCTYIERYKDEMRGDANYNVYREIELPIIPAICAMEECGIKADREFFKKEKELVSKRLTEKENDIYKLAGCRFNINSPKQVGEVLFEKLKIKSQRKTKTGYSTDFQVLDSLSDEHPIAAELLYYREFSKLLSGFIEPILSLIKENEIIHTTFEQSFAATGRFSSRNPNMQNVPPDIRKGFVVRDEKNIFLSVDYSQIELRVLAVLSKDDNLLKAFSEGRDIHNQTAMRLFNVPEEMISERMRSIAKIVNFSVLYGKTPFGLSQELKIPRREAERFIDSYFEEYSRVREWIEKTKDETRKTKSATTLFGRVRLIPEINSSNKNVREQAERAAVNMPVQGTAADIIKIAIKNVYERIKEKKDIMMLLTIHDELVFEVKEESVEKYEEIIKETMTDIEGFKEILKVKS
ncbi:MAG: DNA polymerase, partial [bacterium]